MKTILKVLDRDVGLQNMTMTQVRRILREGLSGAVEPDSIDGYYWEQRPYLTDWGEVRVAFAHCGTGQGCFWVEEDYPL